MTVARSGRTVYVGGQTASAPNRLLIAAYAIDTGQRRWLAKLACGPIASDPCWLDAIGLSPDGDTLYLTGRDQTAPDAFTWVTIALDTATASPRWTARASHGVVGVSQLAVSPEGTRIFVSGWVGSSARWGERVIAYRAATGTELWRIRRDGRHGDVAYLGVSANPGRLFVTAEHHAARNLETSAIDAATGSTIWSRNLATPKISDWPAGLAVAPNGRRLFVTDFGSDDARYPELTIAYGTAHGRQLWKAVEPVDPGSMQIAVRASGERVYVFDGYVVVAHDARSGKVVWSRNLRISINWNTAGTNGVDVLSARDRVYVSASYQVERGGMRLLTSGLSSTNGAVRWSAVRNAAGGAAIGTGPSGARIYVAGLVEPQFGTDLAMLLIAYRS